MIRYHTEADGSPLIQGSDAWKQARCGMLTASEMKLVLTPTLKIASNDKERAHLWELLSQRITGYVEPHYVSDEMLRGKDDEIEARALYHAKYAPVEEVGFVTNDKWGFTLGYSPDGLVGDMGLIECKSRRGKYQIETITENVPEDAEPNEFTLQIQTGLLVTERGWCDFVSYSGGLPMATIRVYPEPGIMDAIIAASLAFEVRLAEKWELYRRVIKSTARLIPTERRVEQEIWAS